MSNQTSSLWSTSDYEEACEWFVEFRTATPDTARRSAFHAWLQHSPAHMGAYLEVTAVWNETAEFHPGPSYSIEALISEAAVERDNVRSLDPSVTSAERLLVNNSRRRPVYSLAASLLLIFMGIIGLNWWRSSQIYSTAIGEQRSVVLKDGSIIQLNSRSRIEVRYTDHDREIELKEGQALFTVAHDTQRPFFVSAGSTAVRAVGTQFDVNRLETATVVTVLEGRVTVESAGRHRRSESGSNAGTSDVDAGQGTLGSQPAPLSLAAGQQLRLVRSGGVHRSAQPDIVAATSWTQRRLVFEGTPLADVVEEFNRYNSKPLHLLSPGLGRFEIDGVFSSTDPKPMIGFLRSRPGIAITETDAAIEISEKP